MDIMTLGIEILRPVQPALRVRDLQVAHHLETDDIELALSSRPRFDAGQGAGHHRWEKQAAICLGHDGHPPE